MNLLSSTSIFAHISSGAGTLGGFFTAGDNSVYGISNNHVIANINNCHVNDGIFFSGGPNANQKVGALQTWVTLDGTGINYLDVAFFKVDSIYTPQWQMPNGVSGPSGFGTANDNDPVYMMLANGTKKTGTVSTAMIDFNLRFELGGSGFSFTSLIEIESTIVGTAFSVPGESGSIIFNNANAILGVLLGTNSTTTRSYAIPFIDNSAGTGILDIYDLKIA